VLTRQLFVIPGGRRVGRQHGLIGKIDARIARRAVGAQIEIEDLREQDDPVEIDCAVRLELIDEHRRARRTVALAEQILGRIPAAVLRQELRNEFGKSVRVLVDSVERLLLVLPRDAAETGAGRVDEDEIGGVEQARRIVDQRIRRGRRMHVGCRDDAPRPKGAHVQPQGRGARAAVVHERHRPRSAAVLEIGHIEDRGLRRRVLGFPRIVRGCAALVGLGVARHVVPILGMHYEGSGDGLVGNVLTADVDRAAARRGLGLERLELAALGFVRSALRLFVRRVRRALRCEQGCGRRQCQRQPQQGPPRSETSHIPSITVIDVD